jgi:hypothetical protein
LNLPPTERLEALNLWFQKFYRNFEQFFEHYKSVEDKASNQFVFHQKWVTLSNIEMTPAFVWDGINLPEYYTIADIYKVISLNS